MPTLRGLTRRPPFGIRHSPFPLSLLRLRNPPALPVVTLDTYDASREHAISMRDAALLTQAVPDKKALTHEDRPSIHLALALALALARRASGCSGRRTRTRRATRNVVLVTTDGLRWQEVFAGPRRRCSTSRTGASPMWSPSAASSGATPPGPGARRSCRSSGRPSPPGPALRQRRSGSVARVANGKNFSYPGYNEMLTGAPDARIDSNAKRPTPTSTSWSAQPQAGLRGKVAAVCSWDVFPYILNVQRSGLPVNAGWVPLAGESLTPGQLVLNRMIAQSPRVWENSRYDAFTFQVAMEQLRRDAPRVLYIGLGDTDEHSHNGRYDHYLRAARHFDANLKSLWDELQSRPESRGTTTMIVTTDHGRGDPPRGWRDHGVKTAGSEASGSPSSAPTPPRSASARGPPS